MSSRSPRLGSSARTERCTCVCTSNAVMLVMSIVGTSRHPPVAGRTSLGSRSLRAGAIWLDVFDVRRASPLADLSRRDARRALLQPQLTACEVEDCEICVDAGHHPTA